MRLKAIKLLQTHQQPLSLLDRNPLPLRHPSFKQNNPIPLRKVEMGAEVGLERRPALGSPQEHYGREAGKLDAPFGTIDLASAASGMSNAALVHGDHTADGHPVHRSRRVRDGVAAHADRLKLFFLPPYRPEVNPTEYLNNAVKGTVPRVKRARSRDELAGQVRLYLRIAQRRPEIVRRFFEAEPVSYAA